MAPSLKSIFPIKGKKRPLLNNAPGLLNNRGGRNQFFTSTREKVELWNFFKSRPELNAPVSARVNDTITGVDFYSTDGKPLGPTQYKKAQAYWNSNFMHERLKSIWFDAMVTGDGFGWDGGLEKGTLAKELQKKLQETGISYKELVSDYFLKAIDEDERKVRIFDYVASSTMSIDADTNDVHGYVQRTGGQQREFSKEEIVHFKFQSIDGRVEGYSPVSSLRRELILIYFIKENMAAHFRNGGAPNKLYMLKGENANSPNHVALREQLAGFEFIENRNGSLVLTGDVDVEDLQEKLRDMEYGDVARYVMSNIAYALQLPASRLPYGFDGAPKSDAGGLSEAGYWSVIESDQRYIEQMWNTQIGNKLGFHIKLKKPYKIDDVRETQVMTMKADAIQKMQAILKPQGKKLSLHAIEKLMGFEQSDIEELSPEERLLPEQRTGLMNQNMLNNNQVMMNQDQSARSDRKRTEAINNPSGQPQDGN